MATLNRPQVRVMVEGLPALVGSQRAGPVIEDGPMDVPLHTLDPFKPGP